MDLELDRKLCEDFPLLFRIRRGPRTCWHFECGDGWEPIIRRLAEKLEPAIAAIPARKRAYYHAAQVKEKFGTLRFYMNAETEEMSEWIQAAESESASVCEVCGAPGELNGKHWLQTTCEEHAKP